MIILPLEQGTKEWLEARFNYRTASECAAMLGVSPYMTRDELLRQKKTGLTPEVSDYQQKIFDQGHQIEALLRSYAEEVLEQELFPCVGELEGTKLSASFDGLTMDGKTVWECKTLNHPLRMVMTNNKNGADLPLHYRVQLEQQLLVSGAEKALFMAGELDDADGIGECFECWYTSDSVLRQRILDGWQQFEKDLEAYQVQEKQAPINGKSPDTHNPLPVLHIAATGQLLASNLDDFKTKALSALAQINTDLVSDQDFADAESAVKFCKQVESALSKAKETLYSGAGIALALNELSNINDRFKETRLTLDKTIKAKKESRKNELIRAATDRVHDYIDTLNEALPDGYQLDMRGCLSLDLATAIKGLKTLSSIQNALDRVVLQHQSEANQEYQRQQQQAQADAIEAENAIQHAGLAYADDINVARTQPPLSLSETELARIAREQDLLNRQLYPLQILNFSEIKGLQEALPESWPAIKQALIDHIERAIPV